METQFNKIYEMYNQDIYRLIYSYTLDCAESKDILQETFLKYYKNINKLPTTSEDIKKWLIKVSINTSKDHLRKIIKCRFIFDNEIYKSMDSSDLEVIDILKKLNKKYRIPIFLYYYEGYKIQEIATLLHLKESAVKMRISRARKIIKEEMELI